MTFLYSRVTNTLEARDFFQNDSFTETFVNNLDLWLNHLVTIPSVTSQLLYKEP